VVQHHLIISYQVGIGAWYS